jgi:hypothetical protein
MSMKIKNVLLCLVLLSSTFHVSAHDITSSHGHAFDPVEQVFTRIYRTNQWGSPESISGPGSELRVTHRMRQDLSALIKRFGITSIADAPCGDLNWMKHVDIGTCAYIGFDVVQELIERNRKLFATKEFRHLNLIENVIEKVDLIICRDMLAHLTNEQVFTVLRNFKKSGSKYILMTTGLTIQHNSDISVGDWRGINFELAPFNLPRPLALIEEDVPFAWERGKYLGLWFLEDIQV